MFNWIRWNFQILNPTEAEISKYEEKRSEYLKEKEIWQKLVSERTLTADGTHVELAANIGTTKDLEGVIKNGAEGIGLFRTEFLYMGLHKELGEWMTDNVTVVRYNDKLQSTDEKIQELMERYQNININDTARWSNQDMIRAKNSLDPVDEGQWSTWSGWKKAGFW